MRYGLLMIGLLLWASSASAQIGPPTGPVTFCGTQAQPAPDSYTVRVDGGTPQPLTLDVTPNAQCPAGQLSFQLPAAAFVVGQHSVQVIGRNTFGSTDGAAFTVTVGIAPGEFTITSVIPPATTATLRPKD